LEPGLFHAANTITRVPKSPRLPQFSRLKPHELALR
jgi:hypothetical protein